MNQRSRVSSGGSGAPVSTSAGVCPTSGASTGGGVRARAAATPLAMPMNTNSSETTPQKRREPFSSAMREIRRRRYQAPSTPIATRAKTFTSTSTPYADQRFCSPSSPIEARTVPDTATTTKATSASEE